MASYSSIITALVARVQAQQKSGGLLYGLNFRDYPIVEVEGERDLPMLRLFIPDLEETFRHGKPTKAAMTLRLTVSASRAGGMAALVKWTERVLDALDLANDGTIDPLLVGTLRKPFDVKSDGGHAQGVSMTQQLTLFCTPQTIPMRGKRSK